MRGNSHPSHFAHFIIDVAFAHGELLAYALTYVNSTGFWRGIHRTATEKFLEANAVLVAALALIFILYGRHTTEIRPPAALPTPSAVVGVAQFRVLQSPNVATKGLRDCTCIAAARALSSSCKW